MAAKRFARKVRVGDGSGKGTPILKSVFSSRGRGTSEVEFLALSLGMSVSPRGSSLTSIYRENRVKN